MLSNLTADTVIYIILASAALGLMASLHRLLGHPNEDALRGLDDLLEDRR